MSIELTTNAYHHSLPKEGVVDCYGIKYAFQDWSLPLTQPSAAACSHRPLVLAVHGWLDNCASFSQIAPLLAPYMDIIALDVIGHGKTQWLPVGRTYQFLEMVSDLVWLIDHFTTTDPKQSGRPLILMGHSMGGAICTTAAAVRSEQVSACITIDALGPFFATDESVVSHFQKSLHNRSRQYQKVLSRTLPKYYRTKEQAVQARIQGGWPIKDACAQIICERGLQGIEGQYHWVSDPRLLSPSFNRLNLTQCLEFLKAITCPVYCVEADQGLVNPESGMGLFQEIDLRKAAVPQLYCQRFSGWHHLHMEAQAAPQIAEWLIKSLNLKNAGKA